MWKRGGNEGIESVREEEVEERMRKEKRKGRDRERVGEEERKE